MGASVINMTTVPEVILAKELGLCYASVAMVTDYDSWLDIEGSVDVQRVEAVMKSNIKMVQNVIIEAVKMINADNWEEVFDENQVHYFGILQINRFFRDLSDRPWSHSWNVWSFGCLYLFIGGIKLIY